MNREHARRAGHRTWVEMATETATSTTGYARARSSTLRANAIPIFPSFGAFDDSPAADAVTLISAKHLHPTAAPALSRKRLRNRRTALSSIGERKDTSIASVYLACADTKLTFLARQFDLFPLGAVSRLSVRRDFVSQNNIVLSGIFGVYCADIAITTSVSEITLRSIRKNKSSMEVFEID